MRLHAITEISLSEQVIQWMQERVPVDDPIRIKSIDKYDLIGEIGKGRFGPVRKYLDTEHMTNRTGKAVKMEMFDHWSQDSTRISRRLDVFIEEFRLLHKISIKNDRIANFHGIYVGNKELLVFTEFLPNGSVKDRLVKDAIPEDIALKYLNDTIEALHYLHSLQPPLIHRDIKAANLLITISDSIKLANFGLVRDLAVDGFGIAVASEITLDFRGTLLYVAPEVLTSELGPGNRKAYGLAADIWALGCTFVEILARFPPHFEYFGQVGHVQNEIVERASGEAGVQLPYSASVLIPTSSEFAQSLLDKMFEKNPHKRPTTAELRLLMNKKPPSTPLVTETELTETETTSDAVDCTPSTSQEPPSRPPILLFNMFANKLADRNESKNTDSKHVPYVPMETIFGGATRRKRKMGKKRRKTAFWRRFTSFQLYFLSRIMYFLSILSQSILYVLTFIIIGMGILSFFLFISYCIVLFARYLIKLRCDCDLSQPQYLIISGILLILLFALFFSCCMVALGEYKFRKANKTLHESKFFVPRPEKDIVLCGVTILSKKKSEEEETEENEDSEDDINDLPEIKTAAPDDEYYR